MIVIVDSRADVSAAYQSSIGREGFTVNAFDPRDFMSWFHSSDAVQLSAMEALVIGDCEDREFITKSVKRRTEVPAIALSDASVLEATLKLFAAGADDVIKKPVHAREIIARIAAIKRRNATETRVLWHEDGLLVPGGGQDIEIHGQTINLPRRELRILEYLASSRGRRVSRAQVFSAVYGVFEEEVEECVVESHISKLRKKLRQLLGHDPIETQRFLGYQLVSKQLAAA